VWWLGQPNPLAWGRRLAGAALPLIATIGTLLTEYEMGFGPGPIRFREGVAMSVVLSVVAVVMTIRLVERRPGLPQ
jgi:hypothetical protein